MQYSSSKLLLAGVVGALAVGGGVAWFSRAIPAQARGLDRRSPSVVSAPSVPPTAPRAELEPARRNDAPSPPREPGPANKRGEAVRKRSPRDGVAWLRSVEKGDPALEGLVADPERFAGLFEAHRSAVPRAGETFAKDDPLPAGSVLTYPPGVFAVADLARERDPFPSDITLRGAGMDATLLVMHELGPTGALERFAIEDCTVFAEDGIVDVRSAPAVLALRRVRLVGFDCGAGGSYAMRAEGCALLAQQCNFEGGYGRSPGGYANLMRRSTVQLARFETCLFDRVDLADADRGDSRVVFAACVMNELLREPGAGPRYQDCIITLMPEEQRWSAEARRRDLNNLFPGWRERSKRR